MFLSILTPTYNRESTLQRLWASLEQQSFKDFEWLIVDDGSIDGTHAFVDDIRARSDLNIRYLYKQNGGKHTALNLGVEHAQGKLTFIVDSDDWLTSDAVAQIRKIYDRYKDHKEICGYSFLRKFPDGEINGDLFEQDYYEASYIEARVNSSDTHADKAEVYFTHVLREFPFPEFPDEKFLGEDVVWMRIARNYRMIHINKAIYIGDYLSDGLTSNRRSNNIKSPQGCFCRAIEFTYPDVVAKQRIKAVVQLIVYGKFAGKTVNEIIKASHSKIFTLLLLPAGFVIYRLWRHSDSTLLTSVG